jgi:hypothetical protein
MYLGAPSGTYPLYVFDSDMEARVNMRRIVTNGLDMVIVQKIQRVLNLVQIFLRGGEFIRNQEVFQGSIGKPWELIAHV